MRKKAVQGIKEGDSFTITRVFTEQDLKLFGDLSGDYNPVHYDERYAKSKKLNGTICHGLLVACMVTEIGGQLGILAESMNFIFKKPVYIGDKIECCCTFTEIDEKGRCTVSSVFKNQDGEIVLECTGDGILPTHEDREILKAMLNEGDPTNKIRQ